MISIHYGLPTKKPIHVKRLSYITRGNTQFDIQIENFLRNSSHSVLYIKNALVEVMQQVCNLDNVYLSSNPIYFLGFVGLQISLFTYKTLVVKAVKLEKVISCKIEKLTTKAVSMQFALD